VRTYIGQFLKGRRYSEMESIQRLTPYVTLEQYGLNDWVHVDSATPDQRAASQEGLSQIRQALTSGEYDIVIADEVNITLYFSLLTQEQVIQLIDARSPHVELVLTGRRAPDAIIERADLVTEMREVRHPYQQGITARPGIEF